MTANRIIKTALEHINQKEFRAVDCSFAGDDCTFIAPIAFPKWTPYTKYLRSVIFRKADYAVISAGFPKFPNWGEQPEVFPVPTSLNGVKIVSKIDGSLLCVSAHKGELIIRTRGSTSVESCKTKDEIEFFKKNQLKYLLPRLLDESSIYSKYTFLFEWVGSHKIVIDYGNNPQLILIGVINNSNYQLFQQEVLDVFADLFKLSRPDYFNITSFDSLFEVMKKQKGIEGYCIYSNDGQDIHKAKTDDYLIKHRFKSNLTYENMVDYFVANTNLSKEEMLLDIASKYDFECSQQANIFLEKISFNYKVITDKVESCKQFLNTVQGLRRKDVAKMVQDRYSNDESFKSVAFQLLDGKQINNKKYTSLLNEYNKN